MVSNVFSICAFCVVLLLLLLCSCTLKSQSPTICLVVAHVIINVLTRILIGTIVSYVRTFVLRFPCHLILLLQSTTSIGKPCGDLCQCHLGYDCQHDLLSFGWIWILSMFIQPCLERIGRLSGCILPSCGTIDCAITISIWTIEWMGGSCCCRMASIVRWRMMIRRLCAQRCPTISGTLVQFIMIALSLGMRLMFTND